jgi:enoyl-CoA hydratase/carnithine racemase
MKFAAIRLTETQGVATLALARPAQGNAINVRMIEELLTALHWIEDEAASRAVVLRGAGRMFCAGIDLADFPLDTRPDVYGFSKWEKVVRALERLPRITVAAIDGECVGGGLHLALACDVRVATKRAGFRLNEVGLGFVPGMATFRLAKFIGLGRAKRLALTGRAVEAAEAERIGLVDHLCAPAALDAAISRAVEEFGEFHADAHELTRRLLDESFAMSYEDFLGGFLAAQDRAIQSAPFRDAVRRAHRGGKAKGKR